MIFISQKNSASPAEGAIFFLKLKAADRPTRHLLKKWWMEKEGTKNHPPFIKTEKGMPLSGYAYITRPGQPPQSVFPGKEEDAAFIDANFRLRFSALPLVLPGRP
ncbi:MAG: hypothetical protein U1C55_02940 [Smithellaceae bacterium]|nr:hypothetical protein [Smithellaceae bacterium]